MTPSRSITTRASGNDSRRRRKVCSDQSRTLGRPLSPAGGPCGALPSPGEGGGPAGRWGEAVEARSSRMAFASRNAESACGTSESSIAVPSSSQGKRAGSRGQPGPGSVALVKKLTDLLAQYGGGERLL